MKNKRLRNEYLICYDVEDNKIRRKVYIELGKYGLKPVQKSVFWGYLTLAELNSIKRYLENSLNSKDKVFITKTNFNGRGQSFIIGSRPEEFKDWDEYYVL